MFEEFDQHEFVEGTFSAVEKLIRLRFFDETINPDRLSAWRNNFEGMDEQILAARILADLMYRPRAMIQSYLVNMIDTVARVEFNRFANTDHTPREFLALLSRRNNTPIRFVTAQVSVDDTTSSGPQVGRLLRDCGVHGSFTATSPGVKDRHGNVVYVLVDDNICSGNQARSIIDGSGLTDGDTVIYAPIMIRFDGAEQLAERYPWVQVAPGEVLSESALIMFSEADGESELKIQYERLMDRLDVPNNRRYGVMTTPEQSILWFAGTSSPPNGNLPVIWSTQIPGWTPLIQRYS